VKAARRKPGSTWHLDEMFVTLRGEAHLQWRAVDEHGAELDILLQEAARQGRTGAPTIRFLKRIEIEVTLGGPTMETPDTGLTSPFESDR
jgi:putative transposase